MCVQNTEKVSVILNGRCIECDDAATLCGAIDKSCAIIRGERLLNPTDTLHDNERLTLLHCGEHALPFQWWASLLGVLVLLWNARWACSKNDAYIVIAAYMFADLTTGVTHLYFDISPFNFERNASFLSRILNNVRINFRMHHLTPGSMEYGTPWWNHLSEPWLVITPLMLLCMVCPWRPLVAFMVYNSVIGSIVQVSHRMSHRRTRYDAALTNDERPYIPVIWRTLQDVGLVLRPAHHQVHHKTETRNFSIIHGWSSALLNLIVRHYALHTFMHDGTKREWDFVLRRKKASTIELDRVVANLAKNV